MDEPAPVPRRLWVVIPALDEEASIGLVLDAIPSLPDLTVVVADNGSQDATARVAADRGAVVVSEPRRGYGQACLAALQEIRGREPSGHDIVVFLDADFSDDPTELPELIWPLLEGGADLVVGSRVLGEKTRGALLPQARFGNLLATTWIWWLTGVEFTDLGPFRAITWESLEQLFMEDTAYGWTVEMQLKAAEAEFSCVEIPVRYRPRRGVSKITGTLKGTIGASFTILSILARWGMPGRGGLWRRSGVRRN